MKSLNFTFIVIVFHTFIFLAVSNAKADAPTLSACNETEDTVSFSVGGFDSETDGFQWRSEGWWTLDPGECTDYTLSMFHDRHLFIHGDGGGGNWTGEYLFCVNSENAFDAIGAYDCESNGDGFEQRRFFHKTGSDGDFYVNFVD